MNRLIYVMLILATAMISASVKAQSFTPKNKSVDLRGQIAQYGLPVRNQSPRGTCTLFAVTFLVEYSTAQKSGAKNLDYSEEYLNAVANRSTGVIKDGSDFAAAISGYEEFGIVNESQAPYKFVFDAKYLQSEDKATVDLLNTGKSNRAFDSEILFSANIPNKLPGLTDEQVNALLSQLDNGIPVAVGHGGDTGNTKTFPIGNGNFALDEFDLKNLKNPYVHTVPLVGYSVDSKFPGGGYVIFRNTGGKSWGDQGYGYMTFKYLKNYSYDGLILKKPEQRKPGLVTSQVDINLIEKQFLKRKDILRQNSMLRQGISLPYIQDENMKKLGNLIRSSN